MLSRMKAKMRTGEPVFGGGGGWWYPEVAEVLDDIGLDFVHFDMQHGSVSYETIQRYIHAIDQTKTTVIGRAASSATVDISKILDVGALGVIVPDVDSKDETIHVLNAAKYPPVGTRSIDHLMTPAEARELNENIVVIPMIETLSGLANINDIVSVEGVDGIYIGPNDLSCSLGIFTEWRNTRFVEAIEKIAEACKKRAVYCGIMAPIEPPEKPVDIGCKIYLVGVASSFMRTGGIRALQQAKDTVLKRTTNTGT
jgi:2-keto-3-deoxy-L-rhamnonate aldolase RhmA